jgi:hypothetical protein
MNLICTALYNAAPTHPSHKYMFCESSPANYHIEFSHIAALPDPMSLTLGDSEYDSHIVSHSQT